MTIHAQCLLNTISTTEAFARRPGLIKQIDSQIDPLQRTPLIVALSQGNLRWFEQLLEKGADVQPQDTRGWTALHHAVEKNNIAAAKQIMERVAATGLDVRAYVNVEGKCQETAYELAIQALENAQETYEDAKWDAKTDDMQLAGQRRKVENAQELVDLLVCNGASDAVVRQRVHRRRQIFCCGAAPFALVHAA
eukprot:COSAG02_NODE_24180_length_695_cov_1.904362_1_plen_193_part_10